MSETIPFTLKEIEFIKKGPIILVEDNPADQKLFQLALEAIKVPNEIIYARNAEEALDFLTKKYTHPFLIICDFNMPTLNGLQLKEVMNNRPELKKKGIPFIIMTSSDADELIAAAYQIRAHGYFVKAPQFDELTKNLKVIVDYWTYCRVPAIY